jgi:hypothetical protein
MAALVRFSALDGDELDAGSADRDFRFPVDDRVGLETLDVIHLEPAAEEVPAEHARRSERSRKLLLVVAARVKPWTGREAAEETVPADMIPVGMRHQHRRQFGQSRCVGAERLVRGLC